MSRSRFRRQIIGRRGYGGIYCPLRFPIISRLNQLSRNKGRRTIRR